MLAKRETKRATESMGPRMKRRQKHDYEVGQRKYDESRDNEEAKSMNEETSAGAPPRVQARGRDAAMQTKTATRTDRRPTRRRGESLAAVRPPDGDTIGSRVEGAAREGLTAPEVLALALLALLFLVMLGTLFVFSFVYVLVLLVLPGLGILLLWII
jgi:hypothetical protein